MRPRIAVLLLAGAWVLPARTAVAQWGVSAEIGVARFAGTSRDSSGASLRPHRPTTVGLVVDGERNRLRVQLGATYGRTGIAAERGVVAYALYDAASMLEISLRASFVLARLGNGVLARLEAGPAVDLWTVEGESRRRWAGWAGAAVEWPLGRHLRGALRASGALSPSVFDRVDLPDDVERLTTRRWGVAVALRYAK
jgi:hypothetical protein